MGLKATNERAIDGGVEVEEEEHKNSIKSPGFYLSR